LLAQRKVIKAKGTPHHGPADFPPLLTKPGGGPNSLRSNNAHRLPPVLAVLLSVAQGKLAACHRRTYLSPD